MSILSDAVTALENGSGQVTMAGGEQAQIKMRWETKSVPHGYTYNFVSNTLDIKYPTLFSGSKQ